MDFWQKKIEKKVLFLEDVYICRVGLAIRAATPSLVKEKVALG